MAGWEENVVFSGIVCPAGAVLWQRYRDCEYSLGITAYGGIIVGFL